LSGVLGDFVIVGPDGSFQGQTRAFGYKDKSFSFKIVAGETNTVSVPIRCLN